MGYQDYERDGSRAVRKLPSISGVVEAALPRDIHVLAGDRKRIGTEQRQRFADHLSASYGAGFLTEEEHAARHEYVMNTAESLEDLNEVTKDLPPIPRTPVGTKIVAVQEHKTPLLDFAGHPIVAAAVIAGGIPTALFVAGNFAFIFAIMVMVAALGLCIRWTTRRDA